MEAAQTLTIEHPGHNSILGLRLIMPGPEDRSKSAAATILSTSDRSLAKLEAIRGVAGNTSMIGLGVNIDHVATLRQARKGKEPDPVWAAAQAELGGANGITLHVREDRRHIQDRDARLIRQTVQVRYNLEMAATDEMVALALELNPDQVTLVPERREEVTTEGGLDVAGNRDRLAAVTQRLTGAGIEVSMFIDPDLTQVEASREVGADAVELHTGSYAEAWKPADVDREFDALLKAAHAGQGIGLVTHLGHGLNYQNTQRVCRIPGIRELNIGHSIISRAVFVGLAAAVREMKELMQMAELDRASGDGNP